MNMTETPLPGYRPNVGLCITNSAGEVLAGERNDVPGAWQCPQGGIDAGEAIEAAAWRELEEETGLTRDTAALVQIHPQWVSYTYPALAFGAEGPHSKHLGQSQRWCWFRYDGPVPDAQAVMEIEFLKFKWMNAQELLAHVIDFRKPGYEIAFTHFELLGAS